MKLIEKAEIIMKHYICDHCLGRQFGQLLSGYDNPHRGRLVRSIVAMSMDKEKLEENEKKIDMLNLTGFKFHFLEMDLNKMKKDIENRVCYICNDAFKNIEKYVDVVEKSLKGIEFKTFLIGTKVSFDLMTREEKIWEQAGIDYCEPIKAEINREIGKLLEKRTGKAFSVRSPDLVVLLYMDEMKAAVQINPIFIYGGYQKLVRGIPQTKWPEKKYKTSVEEIMAKPFMNQLKGSGHKLHGFGREDIDARCLAWRPFVLEILEPKKRLEKKDLKKLAKKIGKQVKVNSLRLSSIEEVRKIKEARGDKTYRALVTCEKPVDKKDLKNLLKLKTVIHQKTPTRVLHRRADLLRKRKVVSIKTVYKNKDTFEIVVRGEGGLYIKELISGDSGRTEPSVSSMLENHCKCKELDVIGVHMVKPALPLVRSK